MNAFRSTTAVLQLQMANLLLCAVQSNAAAVSSYDTLIDLAIFAKGTSVADKATLVREIEDHEQKVNSAGAAAEILARALREMDGMDDSVQNQYEMIWTVRENARRLASRAEDILFG